jgi:hypothetical protein
MISAVASERARERKIYSIKFKSVAELWLLPLFSRSRSIALKLNLSGGSEEKKFLDPVKAAARKD